ncbi:MAG TPA: multicopper oxidase domain-containing protein [Chthoniobacterales bacterium]
MANPAVRDRPYTGSPVDTVNSVDAEPNWQTMNLNFFTMNGKAYPSTDPIELRLGQKLRVRFFNINLLAHPIHLHGQNFLHIAEDGVTLRQPQEMNTIEVAPGKTQDILIEAQNPGVWPFHCHIAHHQANNFSSGFGGMATVVRIS